MHLIAPEEIEIRRVLSKRSLAVNLRTPTPLEDREIAVLFAIQVCKQSGKRSRLILIHWGVLVRPDQNHRVGRETQNHEKDANRKEVHKGVFPTPGPESECCEYSHHRQKYEPSHGAIIRRQQVNQLRQ